jgi:hypothetical protein
MLVAPRCLGIDAGATIELPLNRLNGARGTHLPANFLLKFSQNSGMAEAHGKLSQPDSMLAHARKLRPWRGENSAVRASYGTGVLEPPEHRCAIASFHDVTPLYSRN